MMNNMFAVFVVAILSYHQSVANKIESTVESDSVEQCKTGDTANTAESCVITLLNVKTARKEFESNMNQRHVLNFYFSGVEINVTDSDNDTTFNPYWWVWVSSRGKFILDVPIDYDILSWGLITQRVGTQELSLNSTPSNCLQDLNYKCRMAMIYKLLENLTSVNGKSTTVFENAICRTAYTHKSFITKKLIGVGTDCCLRGISTKKQMEKFCKNSNTKHEIIRSITFAIGIVLPIIILYMLAMWPSVHPRDISKGIAAYLANRLREIQHFRIVGEGEFSGSTILIDRKDLMAYTSPASILTFSSFKLGISSGKITASIVFIAQYIVMAAWLFQYKQATHFMNYLDTPEKVAFNLRNIPVAWFLTTKGKWPFILSAILLCLAFTNFLIFIFWWLTELRCVRYYLLHAVRRIFLKEDDYENKTKITQQNGEQNSTVKCHPKTGKTSSQVQTKKRILMTSLIPNLEKCLNRLLVFFLVVVGLGSYLVIYGLFHMFMYIMIGLLININIVTPWLTGIGLAFYHIYNMFAKIRTTYTKILRAIFQECMSDNMQVYTARMITTSRIKFHDRDRKVMMDPDNVYIRYKWIKAEKAVVFINDANVPMIQSRLFFHICNDLSPFRKNIKRAILSLVASLMFIALIVFTMRVFHHDEQQSDASLIVTSFVTLMAALLPQFSEMFQNEEAKQLKNEYRQYRVKRKVKAFRPYIMQALTKLDLIISRSHTSSTCQPDGASTPSDSFPVETVERGHAAPAGVNEFELDTRLDTTEPRNSSSLSRQNSRVRFVDDHLSPLLETDHDIESDTDSLTEEAVRDNIITNNMSSDALGSYIDIMYADESGGESPKPKEEVPLLLKNGKDKNDMQKSRDMQTHV